MKLVGADEVILPYVMSGQRVAQMITNPNVEEIFQLHNMRDSETKLEVVDIVIDQNSPFLNKSLRTCGLKRDGLMVIGVRKSNQEFIFAPDADLLFNEGDCLIALGSPESYTTAKSELNFS